MKKIHEREEEEKIMREQIHESDTDLNCSWCDDKHAEQEIASESVDQVQDETMNENDGESCDKLTDSVEVSDSSINETVQLVPSIIHEKPSSDESDESQCDTKQSPMTLLSQKKSDQEEEDKTHENNKEAETSSHSHNNKVSIIYLSFIRGRQMAQVKVNDRVDEKKKRARKKWKGWERNAMI